MAWEALAIGLLAIPIGYLAIRDYWRARRRKAVEDALPQALLEASALPIHTIRDVVSALSHGYGELSRVFAQAERLINAGVPPDRALRSVAREVNSYMLDSAVSIILTGYFSGANWSELLRKTGEDMEAIVDMERQRHASLSLQRYITMLSAAIFVPAVLGIANKMANKLIETGFFEAAEILNTARLGVTVHLIALALMSSLFLAVMDGDVKKSVYYAFILLPTAILVYLFTGGILF